MIDVLKTLNEQQLLILIKSTNLRKKYEDILVKRYVENKSCEDIAEELGVELQTIRNLVCIARKKFYKKIK